MRKFLTTLPSKIKDAMKEGGLSLLLTRSVNKVRWSFYRQNYTEAVTHSIKKKLPNVRVEYCPVQSSPDDVQIAKRILTAFRKARTDERPKDTKDLWSNVLAEGHGDFHAISHDPAKVAEYLNNINQRGLGLGVASSTFFEYEKIKKSPRLQQEFGVLIKDVLICFAEAVGAIPYNTHENLYLDEDEVLEKIERRIGKIIPSTIEGGVYKEEIGGKLFGTRDFWSEGWL